jgi:hypothetical protein
MMPPGLADYKYAYSFENLWVEFRFARMPFKFSRYCLHQIKYWASVVEGEFVTVVEGDVHAAITRSRGNVVHIATGQRFGRSGFRLPAAQDIYSFSETLISILRPNQPSVRCMPGLFERFKAAGA